MTSMLMISHYFGELMFVGRIDLGATRLNLIEGSFSIIPILLLTFWAILQIQIM